MSNARNLSRVFSLSSVVSSLIVIGQEGAIPSGAVLDWPLSVLPTGWIWGDGSVLLSDTPHQALRTALINDGFPHGQDGSGNPKIPDARGRTTAGKDNMGGTAAGRLTSAGAGIDGATLGASGGAEAHTLTGAQSGTPAHSHTASSTHSLSTTADGSHSHSMPLWPGTDQGSPGPSYGGSSSNGKIVTDPAGAHTHGVSGSITTTVNAVSAANASQAHPNAQPTLVLNKIIKT